MAFHVVVRHALGPVAECGSGERGAAWRSGGRDEFLDKFSDFEMLI